MKAQIRHIIRESLREKTEALISRYAGKKLLGHEFSYIDDHAEVYFKIIGLGYSDDILKLCVEIFNKSMVDPSTEMDIENHDWIPACDWQRQFSYNHKNDPFNYFNGMVRDEIDRSDIMNKIRTYFGDKNIELKIQIEFEEDINEI